MGIMREIPWLSLTRCQGFMGIMREIPWLSWNNPQKRSLRRCLRQLAALARLQGGNTNHDECQNQNTGQQPEACM